MIQKVPKGLFFKNPTSDRGLISNIHKELKKLDPRKANNPIKKWGIEIRNFHLKNF